MRNYLGVGETYFLTTKGMKGHEILYMVVALLYVIACKFL